MMMLKNLSMLARMQPLLHLTPTGGPHELRLQFGLVLNKYRHELEVEDHVQAMIKLKSPKVRKFDASEFLILVKIALMRLKRPKLPESNPAPSRSRCPRNVDSLLKTPSTNLPNSQISSTTLPNFDLSVHFLRQPLAAHPPRSIAARVASS